MQNTSRICKLIRICLRFLNKTKEMGGGGWRDIERQGDSRERIKKGIAKSKGDGKGEKGRGGREEVRWGVNTGVRARKEKEARAPCWGGGGGGARASHFPNSLNDNFLIIYIYANCER